MFGHRYWGRRIFAPRYWGDGGSAPPPVVVTGQAISASGGSAPPAPYIRRRYKSNAILKVRDWRYQPPEPEPSGSRETPQPAASAPVASLPEAPTRVRVELPVSLPDAIQGREVQPSPGSRLVFIPITAGVRDNDDAILMLLATFLDVL